MTTQTTREAIQTIGDFTVAIEQTSLQGWKVLVIGGPTPRTLSVGFQAREAAENAALAVTAKDMR